jgi:hypothetical protein
LNLGFGEILPIWLGALHCVGENRTAIDSPCPTTGPSDRGYAEPEVNLMYIYGMDQLVRAVLAEHEREIRRNQRTEPRSLAAVARGLQQLVRASTRRLVAGHHCL